MSRGKLKSILNLRQNLKPSVWLNFGSKLCLCLLLGFGTFIADLRADETPVFRFTLFNEPHSLDPQKTSMSNGVYLFTNVFRGLMRIDEKDQVQPEMAESCVRKRLKDSTRILCKLRPDLLWSDGSKLKADDFLKAFQALIDPKNKYGEAEILLAIKNARAILRGQKPPEEIGVRVLDGRRIEIELSEDDEDFEWKLAFIALSPRPPVIPERDKASTMLVNGPYKIESWKTGSKITLKPNPYYKNPNPKGAKSRPDLEVLFIQDDALALRMYEGGLLNFNRRILFENVAELSGRPGFKRVPLARFDYIGFGPVFKDIPKLRQAIVRAADYSTFAQLFDSKTTAGCPSIDKSFFSPYFCVTFDLDKAKALLKNVSDEDKERTYVFGFSQLGGPHTEKGVQWFQNQWKKNLGLKIDLKSEEQGVYLAKLKKSPPDFFRKGVSMDRMTCLAGLELFESTNPENYVKFNSKEYDNLIRQLNKKQTPQKRRELCSKAFKILTDEAVIIPFGEMYFNVIGDPKFKGWTLNSLNILDLTNLQYVSK